LAKQMCPYYASRHALPHPERNTRVDSLVPRGRLCFSRRSPQFAPIQYVDRLLPRHFFYAWAISRQSQPTPRCDSPSLLPIRPSSYLNRYSFTHCPIHHLIKHNYDVHSHPFCPSNTVDIPCVTTSWALRLGRSG
jgi:hypothetical protein